MCSKHDKLGIFAIFKDLFMCHSCVPFCPSFTQKMLHKRCTNKKAEVTSLGFFTLCEKLVNQNALLCCGYSTKIPKLERRSLYEMPITHLTSLLYKDRQIKNGETRGFSM